MGKSRVQDEPELDQVTKVLLKDSKGDTIVVHDLDELIIFAAGRGWIQARTV